MDQTNLQRQCRGSSVRVVHFDQRMEAVGDEHLRRRHSMVSCVLTSNAYLPCKRVEQEGRSQAAHREEKKRRRSKPDKNPKDTCVVLKD
jgi:hypothetical protein